MKGPVSVRPTVTGASLRRAAARLPEPRVRDESTFPPEPLLLGARQSQELKVLCGRPEERSSPLALIWVRSFPSSANGRSGWWRMRRCGDPIYRPFGRGAELRDRGGGYRVLSGISDSTTGLVASAGDSVRAQSSPGASRIEHGNLVQQW
jgi:hypothetical protein